MATEITSRTSTPVAVTRPLRVSAGFSIDTDYTCCILIHNTARRGLMRNVPVVFFLISASLTAQSITGSISGSVLDPSGQAIAGASVNLLNDETREARSTGTNETGDFTFFSLLPGAYSVTITQAGF